MPWINEIDLSYKNSQGTTEIKKYNLGSTFDQIFLNITSTFSLENFFNQIKAFFDKQMHMIYQSDEPADLKIMEWYQVTPESSAPDSSDEKMAAANNDPRHRHSNN